MTAPILALPLPQPSTAPAAKRRVLLVDTSSTRRDLRAETMRKLGMDVDCAADINEARSWWRADLYNLVLLNVENDLGHRDKFCADIRGATPPQQIAFLVGKPEYLADSPGTDGTPGDKGTQSLLGDVRTALSANVGGGLEQNWGILEACRRISAVRSVSDARSKAARERPAPPRDSEIRVSRRTLDDLLREETQ